MQNLEDGDCCWCYVYSGCDGGGGGGGHCFGCDGLDSIDHFVRLNWMMDCNYYFHYYYYYYSVVGDSLNSSCLMTGHPPGCRFD